MSTIYIYDPRHNIQEETTVEKVVEFTGFTRKTILYVAREKRRLSVTGCYLSKVKLTVDERRALHSLESFPLERWKDLEGYDVQCQVSDHGRVRSRRTEEDGWKVLTPYFRTRYASTFVKLQKEGKGCHLRVANLVYDAFVGSPKGNLILHKNEIPYDNNLWNLMSVPRKGHHQKTGRLEKGIPVYKIDPDTLEIIDEYVSLKEASMKNFTRSITIRETCQGIRSEIYGMRFCFASRYEELKTLQPA